jgi:signal transduction histidine kinase
MTVLSIERPAEDRERRRIADGLHDDVGQNLISIQLALAALRRRGLPGESGHLVDEIDSLLARTLHAVRTLTFDLGSPVLAEFGLAAALEDLAERTMVSHGLRIHVDAESPGLSCAAEAALFRAARELVSNAARHAEAQDVWLELSRDGDRVRLSVSDNGRGIASGALAGRRSGGSCYGLCSLRQRMARMGGEIAVGTRPGGGTRVKVILPDRRGEDA